jgi:hypothetical protein
MGCPPNSDVVCSIDVGKVRALDAIPMVNCPHPSEIDDPNPRFNMGYDDG